MCRTERWRALAGLLLAWPALAGPLADRGLPDSVRALSYPLDARRDGHPFDADGLVRWATEARLNTLVATVGAGPGSDDAQALLDAAAPAALAVVLEPVPAGDPAAARALAQRFGAHAALKGWAVPAGATAVATALRASRPARPLLGLTDAADTAALRPASDVLVSTRPALYQRGQSYGRWARGVAAQRRAFDGPLLARIECAPPAAAIAAGWLASRAAHPDLFDGRPLRPESVAELAGEWLLVPEPAQLRLQTYAALGAGARGVIFDGAGWLLSGGPDPLNSTDRRAEVVQLATELAWFEPWLAGGEPLDKRSVLADSHGAAAGAWSLPGRGLVLAWRDRPMDSSTVGGLPLALAEFTLPGENGEDLRVDRLAPTGVLAQTPDPRDRGLRLTVPDFDLTAAFALGPDTGSHRAWRGALRDELAANLEASAGRALLRSQARLAKVQATLTRLAAGGGAPGGRAALELARAALVEGAQAWRLGYARTALDQAAEGDRLLRVAQWAEYGEAHAAKFTDPRREAGRSCFAALPYFYQPRPAAPAANPLPLPFSLLYRGLTDGALPPLWRALRGFDQTVATLAARDGQLCWQPVGREAGALSLPFAPSRAVRVALALTVTAPLAGSRIVALAPAAGAAPLGGVVFRTDGQVAGWPTAGATTPYQVGTRATLVLHLLEGRLWANFAGHAVGVPVPSTLAAGTLTLAKPAGEPGGGLLVETIDATQP